MLEVLIVDKGFLIRHYICWGTDTPDLAVAKAEAQKWRARLIVRQMTLESGRYHLPDGSCLLYTSPSPRDRQKSRMPSSA